MGIPYAEVIGDPIAHSKSPRIHKFWLEKLGMEGDYRGIRVSDADLPAYLESRCADPDWRGCNVAMPLKESAFRRVTADPVARRIGAINTIIHHGNGVLVGTNTDWQGIHFSVDLDRLKPERVAVIGAGGAARAVLEELKQAEVPHVLLVNRTKSKARELLASFGLEGDVLPIGSSPEVDLLINASPLGMQSYPPLEIDLSSLASDATVFDMVYDPVRTPLLEAARARGLETVDGLTMLINQAAMAFTCFFKASPDPNESLALRELLTQ